MGGAGLTQENRRTFDCNISGFPDWRFESVVSSDARAHMDIQSCALFKVQELLGAKGFKSAVIWVPLTVILEMSGDPNRASRKN